MFLLPIVFSIPKGSYLPLVFYTHGDSGGGADAGAAEENQSQLFSKKNGHGGSGGEAAGTERSGVKDYETTELPNYSITELHVEYLPMIGRSALAL